MNQHAPRKEMLFKAASELTSAAERVAFLDRECAGDAALRKAVESLLRAKDDAGRSTVFAQSDATMLMPGSGLEKEASFIKPEREGPARNGGVRHDVVTLPTESYAVGGEIARGGMGSILEADDRKLGRKVAMKVMRLEASASEDSRGRFVREATVLARLEHPNIVPIHELGWDAENRLFYTMKLVQGRTLRAILNGLKARDPEFTQHYTLDRLLTIFRKICDALSLAHAKGVIHRDLKPENVMVGEFGEVLVMDWGIAKILGDAAQVAEESAHKAEATAAGTGGKFRELVSESLHTRSPETVDGTLIGTPQYMSPEQADGRVSDIDQQSDVFSLGAILYTILALHPPVEAGSVHEVLERIKRGEIRPPTEAGGRDSLPHCPGGKVPVALSAVAMRALSVDKARRYATVAALAADIEAYQSGFATNAEQASLMKQLLLLIQRHRGVFATAAAAWFIITALAVWFVINVTRAKEQAENERNRATANEQKARRNAEIAAENERKATHHAEVAAQNAAEARAAEKVATERQEATRRALAKARIAVADAAYRNNNAREMQAALKEVPEDLRDADWSYLTAKSDVSIAKVLPGVELTGVAAHPKEPGVFAVGGEDGKVAILRARTSEVLLEFEPVFSPQKLPAIRGFKLAFSPDGERIAIGHNGTGILIHSARDGKKLVEWDSLRTGDLHFSPNGRLLLQEIHIHPHHNIALWDVTTGKQLWSRWNPEDKNLQGAVFTPDGKRIICIQRVGSFVILSVTDGALLKELTPQPGMPFPNQIALASDGKSFIAGGDDGSVLGISLGDGRVLFKGGPYGERIRQLAFTPDGSRIVAIAWHGDGRQSIQFFGGKSGKPLATLLGGNAAPNAVSVHPLSGEMLLTGKDSRLWDISTAPEIWTSDKPGPSAQFWGSDHILFASRKSNAAELWDLRESRIIWEPTPLREHNSAHISADGRYAAIPGAPLFILQRTDGIPEVISTKLSCQFQSIVRLSPDGSRIVIREKFGGSTAMVRDSMTGKKPCKLSPEGVVSFNDLGWVGGGTHIVGLATTNDKRGAPKSEEKIVLWDAATGQQLQSVVHPSAMDVLAVSPDGLSFAEAGADRLVRVRDAATLAVKHQFRAHDDRITTLAWHPKKPILATGSADFSVKIWNVETGRSLEEFHGLVNRPNAMSFSPGGTRLACSVNQEGTHVWEPLSLQPAP